MKWLNELNTTSFRIVGTVGLMYFTGFRYMMSDVGIVGGLHFEPWVPAWEWLVFLATMSGVEGAVLIAKRLTDYKYVEAKQPQVPQVNVENATVKTQEVNVTTTPLQGDTQ